MPPKFDKIKLWSYFGLQRYTILKPKMKSSFDQPPPSKYKNFDDKIMFG
jgi:hypothetical protein